MKKLLIILLSMAVTVPAFAESELDNGLKELDIVDDNYVYTDLDLATVFFNAVTDSQAKSLPMSINRLVEITGIMMTPYYSNFMYRYTISFNAEEKAIVKQDLSSKQTLRDICKDYFFSERFMQANNFTMVFSYMDSDYRPIADITINKATCASALAS